MRDFVFEIKKMLIYQKGTWFLLFFFLLKILSLAVNGADADLEADKEDYLYYLEQVKGPLTEETRSFLQEESGKIATAKSGLDELYQKYYEGVLYNKVMPEEELNSLAAPLEERIKREKGFQLVYDQYLYVRENPDNRYFLYTGGWNALLGHERLDFPMFFLVLLLVSPLFCNEYESKMDILLLSSKKGRAALALKKTALALAMILLLSLLSSLMEYIFFRFRCGLEDGQYPLQSLAYFAGSPKNMSLSGAFVRISVYRLFGWLCFSVLILFVSVYTQKTILTLFLSTATILLPYLGLTARWMQYLLPLPLGFLLGSGFFRGTETVERAGTTEPQVVFRAITGTEFTVMTGVLLLGAFLMLLLTVKKYIHFQSILGEFRFTGKKFSSQFVSKDREAGEK